MLKKIQNLIFISSLFILLGQSVFGISLNEYQQNIKNVSESVSYLNYPEEYLTEAENIANEREILKEIRAKLPQTQNVELKDTNFAVNHEWILAKLNEYEKEPLNSTKRTPMIEELSARLISLEVKLEELQKQQLSTQTKDEAKQKLDEILKRAEFQPPKEAQETWFQRKWREFKEWWRSLFPKQEVKDAPEQMPEMQGSPMLANGLLYLVITLAIALVGFLIYRYAPFFVKKFREREKDDKKSRVILGETLSAEDTSHNIFADAEKLAREGNLRGAIRKGYIAFLCELSDRKIIGLARHKTNRDYLRDVRKRQELHQNMSNLTSNFERNWYGLNQTNENDWEEFRKIYQQSMGSKI